MIKDNINILLVSETKLDDILPVGQFYIDGCLTLTALTELCTVAEFLCILEKIFPLKF